jgi:hypothetical protein
MSELGTSIERIDQPASRDSALVPLVGELLPPEAIGPISKEVVTTTLVGALPAIRRFTQNPLAFDRIHLYAPPYTKGVLAYTSKPGLKIESHDPKNTRTINSAENIPVDTLWLPEGIIEPAQTMSAFVLAKNTARERSCGTFALDNRFGGVDPSKKKETASALLYKLGLAQLLGARSLYDLVAMGLFDQTVTRVLASELVTLIDRIDTLNSSARMIQSIKPNGPVVKGLIKAAYTEALDFVAANTTTLETIAAIERDTTLSRSVLEAISNNVPMDQGNLDIQAGSTSSRTILLTKLPFKSRSA